MSDWRIVSEGEEENWYAADLRIKASGLGMAALKVEGEPILYDGKPAPKLTRREEKRRAVRNAFARLRALPARLGWALWGGAYYDGGW